jgi:hypothetical protein
MEGLIKEESLPKNGRKLYHYQNYIKMYEANLENQLIVVDIVDVMSQYVSIQIDIDETKVKAAELVAQNVDIERIIGSTNLGRAINPSDTEDEELRELLIPPLCYYTYARCLRMFQGTFTDSGYTTSTETVERNSAKSVANEMRSIAETLMCKVVEFLKVEDPNTEAQEKKIKPSVRVFGGKEFRGSN